MLTPNSSFISPPTHTLSPFSNHKCICLFWGPWVCFYLVSKFFCSFPPTLHISDAMWCWSLSDTPHVVWSSLAQPCCCRCTISFLLWPIVYVHRVFSIHSSADGHVGCFPVLAVVNSAAMNTGVHAYFGIIILSGYMPKSRIAGSDGSSIIHYFKEPPYCSPQWLYKFTWPPIV